MNCRILKAILLAFAGVLPTTEVDAGIALNLDFGSANSAPSSAFGAASGQAGTWNQISNLVTNSGILDVTGAATSVAISISTDFMNGNFAPGPSDGELLMSDNYFSFNPPWSLTISGLTNGLYDFYLYEPSHPTVSTGAGSLNGIPFVDINGGYSGSFVLGSNYHKLSSVSVVGGTAIATGAGGQFKGLAGMQIVPVSVAPVPEAGSMMIWAGLATIGLIAFRRLS
jgi:hypothetical protein